MEAGRVEPGGAPGAAGQPSVADAPGPKVVIDAPSGLEGVVVADTSVGGVRGLEGFYHYGPYSAVDLASKRSFEDVWHLLASGELPDEDESARFTTKVASMRELPPALGRLLPEVASVCRPLEVLRAALCLLGSELGWGPLVETDPAEAREQCLRLCAAVPAALAAANRISGGHQPLPARGDLGHAANYLWMLHGDEPDPVHARALEQYLILTLDHGLNASTFAARVIASTGADLAAAMTGALGALSGPLHGGAPRRVLEMLDTLARTSSVESWVRAAIESGERIPGFGHRVYRTDDPRSVFLGDLARRLGAPLAEVASRVEETVVEVLAELKPERRLYANVELYAGVVMEACGIPREMLTSTFALSRSVGWSAHVLEQVEDNRIFRPLSRYVGPPPGRSVPPI